MFKSSVVNDLIKEVDVTDDISDGYHTFGELYKHRFVLYVALTQMCKEIKEIWKSKIHSDGTIYAGWFVLGINKEKGKQITYHLPMEYWGKTSFAEDLDIAPEFDGHSSDDVLARLMNDIESVK